MASEDVGNAECAGILSNFPPAPTTPQCANVGTNEFPEIQLIPPTAGANKRAKKSATTKVKPKGKNADVMAVGEGEATTSQAKPTPAEKKSKDEGKSDPNSRLQSPTWSYFDRVINVLANGTEEVKAICKFCKKSFAAKSSNGTSHLNRHHRKCGELRLNARNNPSQQLLQTSFSKGTISNFKFDQQKSRLDLSEMILIHEYPLSIVEHHGFKKFCNGLNPMFKIVSRNTVKKDCFKIYDLEKASVMEMLDKLESRVALTTDMWTSSSQKKGFMAVTAHYIDMNWKLQSRIISFIFVPSPHTAENLSEAIMKVIFDWNIDRKLSTITVDNCSTNDLMLNILVEKLPDDSLLADGRFFHMRCCAHILNLIVKDGLEVIEEAVENVRDSVAYWGGTAKKIEKFEETAIHCKNRTGKKLILDCKTRWNSTYLMLEVACAYKDVFERLQKRDGKYKCLPTEDQWTQTKQICERLKLFYIATNIFSGTKYPTANLYFPQICDIKVAISEWVSCGNEIVEAMAVKMSYKFEQYWSVVHGIMAVAAVLDPRFKSDMLEFYFSKINKKNALVEVEKVLALCNVLFKEYETNECSSSDVYTSGSGSGKNDDELMTSLSDFDAFVAQKKRKHPTKTELDLYLEEATVPRLLDFDILNWWNSNKGKYPILHKMARDILAIPVTSVASECAFSGSGRLISPHRSRLHPKTIEVLMCAQNWLLNKEKGDESNNTEGLEYGKVFEDLDDANENDNVMDDASDLDT